MDRETLDRYLAPYPQEMHFELLAKLFLDQSAQLDALRKAKTPPERKELAALQQEIERAREAERFWMGHTETWKNVSRKLGDEITELKAGTYIPHLEAERDMWHERWQKQLPRIAELLEHRGNVELLERQRDDLERANQRLRNP